MTCCLWFGYIIGTYTCLDVQHIWTWWVVPNSKFINSIKGIKLIQPQWSNTTWRSHRDVLTSREQVSCIYFVCGRYRPYLQSTNLYFRSYLWCNIKVVYMCIGICVWMWTLFLYCWSELTCLHNYSTYDTIGGSSMQLPWVICLVICAFNESLWTVLIKEHTNTLWFCGSQRRAIVFMYLCVWKFVCSKS